MTAIPDAAVRPPTARCASPVRSGPTEWAVSVALAALLGASQRDGHCCSARSRDGGASSGGLFGTGDSRSTLVVQGCGSRRLVLAVLAGAAFGLAGALFQAVLRNPLASPDIIGISQGASVGAVWAMLGVGSRDCGCRDGAGRGLLVIAVLNLVAARGGVAGYRFVLGGVGWPIM